MRATIAWSYDLLSEREQRLFARLGVFVGGFELEAAEQICEATLDDLQSLVDKSLLREGDSGRFFLLETTREYALEHFDTSDDQDQVRSRHARWYFELGVAAGRQDAERARTPCPTATGRWQRQACSRLGARSRHRGRPAARRLAVPHLVGSRPQRELGAGTSERWRIPCVLSSQQRADALAGLGHALAYTDTPSRRGQR